MFVCLYLKKNYLHLNLFISVYSPENEFIEVFYIVVNHIKHRGIKPTEILDIVMDPVKLARQCVDTVEEIWNFFFHVIEEATDLKNDVDIS